ncbi:NADPH-dependent aldehyde reductase-like protein, chloroplastic [Aegilops tauschii subsp. strangulata]|uniref:Short-chain type dehydrogenase/reductase n=1 Tax=Aegilops tauschii subsp. strangulata TaxID=200361 RepID=A0A453DU80_AEGTS|nr:NADPH-dependent aldehyde reductase-like protein, chloroplastic [Aegilops tauschii subsp. strangulata]
MNSTSAITNSQSQSHTRNLANKLMATSAITSPAAPAATLPLAGRVAIVTGASRGIGRGIATHLSSLGASLVLGYASSSQQADALAAELPRAVAVKADVSDEAGVRSLFDAAESAFGGAAHILVACAGLGIGTYPSLANTSTADFDNVFAVNTRGAFLCLREAANRLRRGGGGRIVAVSSTLAATLLPGYAAYAASKAAVEAMVRVAAKELGSARVTVNCVAPGPVATELFFDGKSEEAVERFRAGHPMGRLGEVGDIAPAVGFLCTDAAEWVNGQVIRVNGGIA